MKGAGRLPRPAPKPLKRMAKFFLKTANSIVTALVVITLCLAGAYASYALWDNNQVYAAAENVWEELLMLKPEVNKDGSASFEELLDINPDVCAWVTLDGTKIDYPVVQGETNLTYINQDVYGNFALAGSIYLDSRNSKDFSDPYNLLYGHHMEKSQMFGDLDLYEDEGFFNRNTTGTLLLPDRAYKLEIFACLKVEAGDDNIFDPELWRSDINNLIAYAQSNALFLHEDAIARLKSMAEPQVLALSTCSSDFTDARTIILAVMVPY